MALLSMTPADGWVDLGLGATLIVCQVDPRVSSPHTPAIEVRRGDAKPADDQAGVVQLGGWSIAAANIDALGVGTHLWGRALAPTVRLILEHAP